MTITFVMCNVEKLKDRLQGVDWEKIVAKMEIEKLNNYVYVQFEFSKTRIIRNWITYLFHVANLGEPRLK